MALIVCPTDCATGGVPDVAFNLCSPLFKYGEISALLLAQVGQPLATGDSAEITARLAATDETKIAIVHGYGDLPAAAGEPTRLSSKYTITSPKERTLNFNVADLNDTNYEFLRKIDKCGGRYLMWYITAGGDMYGGEVFNAGNEVTLTANNIIPAASSEVQTGTLVANWTGPMSERKASVLV
ncbi:hypothetical protein [Pontibacter beigongshangensis]|uniref:hypothetical protein n=1 Tax=Pontibacter beigongshangensis TaxID=2574733 RepID=UPI0016506FE9|nr:hypothetical protein [Pontibacter beigongshangensis]